MGASSPPPSDPTVTAGQNRVLKWGTASFVAISLAATAIILLLTKPDLRSIAERFDPGFIAPLALAIIGLWFTDLMRVTSLARALGEKIRFRAGMESVFINYLFSSLTPFEGGGGPVQILWLRYHGVSSAHGTAIIMVKAVMAVMLVAVSGITLHLTSPAVLGEAHLRGLFLGVGVMMAFYVFFVCGSVFAPGFVKRVIVLLLDRLAHTRFAVSRRLDHWEHKGLDWVDRYHAAILNIFQARKLALAECFAWTILYLAFLFATGPICLYLLGIAVPPAPGMRAMALLHFMMYYMPTPGAAGVGEGGFFLLYSPWAPAATLGVATIVWRLTSTYIGVVIGGVIFLSHTGHWAGRHLVTFLRRPRQGR
jgi:uncharacterized protein (TIRG00374 family)